MHASNGCGQMPSWVVVLIKQLSFSELCGGLTDSWVTLTRLRREHPAKFCACCAGLAIVGHAVPGTLISLSVLVGMLIWQFANHNEAIRTACAALFTPAPHRSTAQPPNATSTATTDGAAKETSHSQVGATFIFKPSTFTEESSLGIKQEQQPNSEDTLKDTDQIICTETRKPDHCVGAEPHGKVEKELDFQNSSKVNQEKPSNKPCKLKLLRSSPEKDTKEEPVRILNRDRVDSVPSFEYSIYTNVCYGDQDNYTTSDLATMSLVSPLSLAGEKPRFLFNPAKALFTNVNEGNGQMVDNSKLSGSLPNMKSNVSKFGPIISEGCITHYAEITELTPNTHLPSNCPVGTMEGTSEKKHCVGESEVTAEAKNSSTEPSYCVTSTEPSSRHEQLHLSAEDSLLLSTAPDLSELLSSALEEASSCCPAAKSDQLAVSAEESTDIHSIPQITSSEGEMNKPSTQTCETDEEDNVEGFEVLEYEELQQINVDMVNVNQSQSAMVSPAKTSTGFLSNLLR